MYRIRRKGWIITVDADSASQARYKADQAYRLFHETGRKTSGVEIKRAE